MPQIDNRQHQQQSQQPQIEVDQSCINFMEQAQYATVNLQPVVTTGFATPAGQILSTVPTHEVRKYICHWYLYYICGWTCILVTRNE